MWGTVGKDAATLSAAALLAVSTVAQADEVADGAYLIRAAGCVACHTDLKSDGAYLAGGPELKTPFGSFWAPNITPDPETGLGSWTGEDFRRAMSEGVSPDGSHYYPVFPYPSYTKMTDADIAALWAYLRTVPPVRRSATPHDLSFPYSVRTTLLGWKMIGFTPGPVADDPTKSEAWNRGRYLTDALGHCGECHTPRNGLGMSDADQYLAGNLDGPDGEKVPNITPHATGIGDWSEEEIITLLVDGTKPDWDGIQGSMLEVVEDSTAHLSEDDLSAIATYLLAIPALPSVIPAE